MGRDNIAGSQYGWFATIILFPGMIIQWLLYTGISGKSWNEVRRTTRLARSPLMTLVYSFAAWTWLAMFLTGGF